MAIWAPFFGLVLALTLNHRGLLWSNPGSAMLLLKWKWCFQEVLAVVCFAVYLFFVGMQIKVVSAGTGTDDASRWLRTATMISVWCFFGLFFWIDYPLNKDTCRWKRLEEMNGFEGLVLIDWDRLLP